MKYIFDTGLLPITFYARSMEFIDRDSSTNKCAVTFKAIIKENIEMFISGRLPEKLPAVADKSNYFSGIWSSFQKGGMEDKDFSADKALYLAQASSAVISAMFSSFSEAKGIEKAKNQWWEITVYKADINEHDEKDTCRLKVAGYEPCEEEFLFCIEPVSKEIEQKIVKLYIPYTDNLPEKNNDSLGAIDTGTEFYEVQVLYVGAGLCCRILTLHAFKQISNITYFDMGEESQQSAAKLKDKGSAFYKHLEDTKKVVRTEIDTDVAKSSPKFRIEVIISHWHEDHTSILMDMAARYTKSKNTKGEKVDYEAFWQNVTLRCPGVTNITETSDQDQPAWDTTDFMTVKGVICDAQLLPQFYDEAYANAAVSTNVFPGYANIALIKSDRDDSNIKTAPNPHDHGLCVRIRLASGNWVLIAGDCNYDTVGVGNSKHDFLTNAGKGYQNLVVSHHGGKYSHTGGVQSSSYIPTPVNSGCDAFYSANGVAYGHPNLVYVQHHVGRGWKSNFLHLIPTFGYQYFFMR